MQKKKYWLLLLAFIICVFIYTVIGRAERISDNRLDLFWSYKEAFFRNNYFLAWQIVLNIAILCPVGYILSCALNKKCSNRTKIFFSAGLGAIVSFFIELCQFCFFKGTAELDDILNNTLGSIIGCILFLILNKIPFSKVEKEKFNFVFSICCVVIAILACLITDRTSDGAVRQLAFQATNVNISNDELVIEGFCFLYGYDLMNENSNHIEYAWDDRDYEIILKSTKTDTVLQMDEIINMKNPYVDRYFKSRYEYPKTGFRASVNIDYIELDEEYEIMIKSGRLTISGKTYIKNGQIEKSPEVDNVKLDVAKTDLQNIVKNGYLKAHDKNNNCFVYQYGRDLIWIANDEYEFDPNGLTEMQYLIWTTQPEKISGYDENNHNLMDDRSFIFENREVTKEINAGHYRVAVTKLPLTYSIAFITVGEYGDGVWKWKESFRPRY